MRHVYSESSPSHGHDIKSCSWKDLNPQLNKQSPDNFKLLPLGPSVRDKSAAIRQGGHAPAM